MDESKNKSSGYSFDEEDLQLHDLRISREKLETMKDSDKFGSKIIEGYQNLLDGEIGRSQEIFDNILEKDKQNSEVWYGKGLVNILLEDFDEAIQNFERAINLEPDFKDALYEKGVALYEKGRSQEALEYWKKARSKEETD